MALKILQAWKISHDRLLISKTSVSFFVFCMYVHGFDPIYARLASCFYDMFCNEIVKVQFIRYDFNAYLTLK